MHKFHLILGVLLLLTISSVLSQSVDPTNFEVELLMTIDNDPILDLRETIILIDNQKIKVKYKTGRLILNDEHKKIIMNTNNLVFSFKYFVPCLNIGWRKYNIELKSDLLLQDYLWLRIYNFELDTKLFKNPQGYGFEYDSPIGSSLLPTKRKRILIKKIKCESY